MNPAKETGDLEMNPAKETGDLEMNPAKDNPLDIVLARAEKVKGWVGCRVLMCAADLSTTHMCGVLDEVIIESGPFGYVLARVIFDDREWLVGPEFLTLPTDNTHRAFMTFIPGIYSDAYIQMPIFLEVMKYK